ncbi:MAG: di-heme-cytochrome C peroxidase [Oricola sp.]
MATIRSISKPGAIALVAAVAAAGLAFLAPSRAMAQEDTVCGAGVACLDQGWDDAERLWWYTTSQGSRLLPLSWVLALEEPARESGFFAEENMRALGYLPSPASTANPHGLPVGFAVDEENSSRADIMCETFPNACNGFVMRKPWVGMTCSACHTNDIEYNGTRLRIEGAPTLADFQTLLERLLAALKATHDDQDKFSRFARNVLGSDLSVSTRMTLRDQLAEQIAWQQGLIDRNAPGMRYGYGRLDAQGHILNKVATVGGGAPLEGAPVSDAPASYPHVWNTSQQDRVQWNGIARNILNIPIFGKDTDIGALVRNTSEVIGVFAQIEISPRWKSGLLGYNSSLRLENMIDLERQLSRLKSPRWPEDFLPAIDWAKADRGRAHFEAKCSSCHEDLKWDDLKTPIKVEMSLLKDAGTDIVLACNTFVHRANAGKYTGRKPFIVKGARIKSEDFTRDMLTNAAVGAVIGRGDELLGSLFDDVFREAGPGELELVEAGGVQFLPGAKDQRKKDLAQFCLSAPEAKLPPDDSVLAYKARPLNGIWATAPYLHNGSVPTLYDLLLPSPLRVTLPEGETMRQPGEGDRPSSFHLGSRIYDPVKVGFATEASNIMTRADGTVVPDYEYRVYDDEGAPIPGNYNSGHEYGTGDLTDEQRWELVEYLKSL